MRIQFPVKLPLQKFVKLKVNEKPWIERALWGERTNHIENKILDFSEENPNASCMWEYFKRSMKDATKLCIPKNIYKSLNTVLVPGTNTCQRRSEKLEVKI